MVTLRIQRLAVLLAVLAAGCASSSKVDVREPTSAAPAASAAQAGAGGSVYNESLYRPLFEDRRARRVGDIVLVTINERLSARRKANSSTSRTGSTSVDVPIVQGLPGKSFRGAQLSAQSDNKFDGGGETSSDNVFSGTITTTVIEVLPNGNLVVAGEKRLGVNRNAETLKFSGVVNPLTLGPANTVASTQLADVRLDYKGSGIIDEAQTQGWLARIFNWILPF